MDEFAYAHIERLFDAVRAHYDGSGTAIGITYNCPVTVQFHASCGMSFCGHWDTYTNMGGGWIRRETDYFCPRCGAHVIDEVSAAVHDLQPGEDYAPIDMVLYGRSYKHYLDIVIKAQTVYLDLQKYQPSILFSPRLRKWRIRFDFSTRKATYKDYATGETRDLWPFGALEGDKSHFRVRDTVLGFLHASQILRSELRRKLDGFMSAVSQRFREMQEEHVGHKVLSPYAPTCCRSNMGLYNKPVSNLVWRLAVPDARNLREEEYRMVGTDRGVHQLQRLLDLTRGGAPYLDAVRTVFRIPRKKAIDRVLVLTDMLDLPGVSKLLRIINNYDLAVKACQDFCTCSCSFSRSTLTEFAWVVRLIDRTKGSAEAYRTAHMIMRCRGTVADSIRTYKLLTPNNRDVFRSSHWTVKTAHDQLLKLWYKQEHTNKEIDYNRAAMRLPAVYPEVGISICLPPDTDNLRALGREMHNCAGTYCSRVLRQETVVLGAFDSNNAPVVCLEVTRGALIQAKLTCNKQVSTNPALESIIRRWAEEKGLRISTIDITQERRRAGA
jgi:hypothetical protein